MMRHPSDIEQIKSFVGEAWQKEFTKIQPKYEEERAAEHPESFEDYLRQVEPLLCRLARFGYCGDADGP